MIKNQRKIYYGNYRGEVIDDQDPLKAGRVRIRVFSVYDELKDDELPWAIYTDPFMGGDRNLGGFFVPDVGSIVWVFFEEGRIDQPVYFAGAPSRIDMPAERMVSSTAYPRNKIFKTKAGHVIEIDDTPDDTRIRIMHKSRTHQTYHENGDAVEEVFGNLTIFVEQDATLYVQGNVTETVEGNVVRQVQGNVNELVQGNFTTTIMGRRKEISAGGSEHYSTSLMNISGERVNINKGGGTAIEMTDGEFVYASPYAYTYGAAADLVDDTGANAPFDTPEEADLKNEALSGGGFPEEEVAEDGDDVEEEDEDVTEKNPDCPTLASDVYATPLGTTGRFTVRSFTTGCVFKHPIQAQGGLSIDDIVCNLNAFTENIAEPLTSAYPSLRVNSGFRRGSGTSQHNKGMAADFQLPNGSTEQYRGILQWISANLPYDQCIIETSNGGRSWWIHLSYNRGGSQRKQRLTYKGAGYASGWNL